MNRLLKTIAIAISLAFCLIILADSRNISIARETISQENQPPETVAAIARPLTVRLLGDYVAGSGAIVAHQGSTYRVLTCDHVVALDPSKGDPSKGFKVLTSDGAEYSASKSDRFNFGDLDLAIVEFTSDRQYAVATLESDRNLSLMQPVYVAGFPNYQKKLDRLESTLNLGINAYSIGNGLISLLLNQPLEQGYQIGLNNEIYIGMSGGPVFNQQGELIGIVGRTKYAFGGVDAYRFADGSEPSPKLLEQMQSASWAIPIDRVS